MAQRPIVSALLSREWGRATGRLTVDKQGVQILNDPNKPVLCWAEYIPPDLEDLVDGTSAYLVYTYLGEERQTDPKTLIRKEIARTLRYTVHHRDMSECEINEAAFLNALKATKRVLDYSLAKSNPQQHNDLRGIMREISILY